MPPEKNLPMIQTIKIKLTVSFPVSSILRLVKNPRRKTYQKDGCSYQEPGKEEQKGVEET